MTSPEFLRFPLRPNSAEADSLAIARVFTGLPYSFTYGGWGEAMEHMEIQHQKVRLQTSIDEVNKLVKRRDPIIRETSDKTIQAIHGGDYTTALQYANFLHGYGIVDYKDSLRGEAFNLSLGVHGLFMGVIVGRFSEIDIFLKKRWTEMFVAIQEAGRLEDRGQEYSLLRRVIHIVALHETLGKSTKEYFDPYTLMAIE